MYDGTDLVDFNKYEETPKVSDMLIPKISDHVSLPKEKAEEHSAHYLGGGGPEIHIEKSTGKVLEWKLAK